MHPFTSRDDCYYTDTDSVVLGNPLPNELISSSLIGKFQLEDKIALGFFLAPKCYYYISADNKEEVMKFKGPGKHNVTPEWFANQYKHPKTIEETEYNIPFLSGPIFKH